MEVVMKSRMGETCRMVLREAIDMDKQDKQVLKNKCLSDILSKQHLHAKLNIVKPLYFWARFLHGTRERVLS